MKPFARNRDRAIGICRELNQISQDLRIAVVVLHAFETEHNAGNRVFKKKDDVNLVVKMCVGWMVIALCRFDQLLDPFWDVVPDEQRGECASIRREIAQRQVARFRSSVIAHSFDGRGGPLLEPSEVNRRFVQELALGVTEGWYKWIGAWPGDPERTPGLIGRLYDLRDAILSRNGLTRDDLEDALRT